MSPFQGNWVLNLSQELQEQETLFNEEVIRIIRYQIQELQDSLSLSLFLLNKHTRLKNNQSQLPFVSVYFAWWRCTSFNPLHPVLHHETLIWLIAYLSWRSFSFLKFASILFLIRCSDCFFPFHHCNASPHFLTTSTLKVTNELNGINERHISREANRSRHHHPSSSVSWWSVAWQVCYAIYKYCLSYSLRT